MKKLELKHLAPYLPYGLKCLDHQLVQCELVTLHKSSVCEVEYIMNVGSYEFEIDEIKPILRPLSDMTDINSERMGDLNIDLMDQMQISDFASKYISLEQLSYGNVKTLLMLHIDIFGLIEADLAIDINTLDANV